MNCYDIVGGEVLLQQAFYSNHAVTNCFGKNRVKIFVKLDNHMLAEYLIDQVLFFCVGRG